MTDGSVAHHVCRNEREKVYACVLIEVKRIESDFTLVGYGLPTFFRISD